MVIHEDNTERVVTRLSHSMLTERILEELYDKKKRMVLCDHGHLYFADEL